MFICKWILIHLPLIHPQADPFTSSYKPESRWIEGKSCWIFFAHHMFTKKNQLNRCASLYKMSFFVEIAESLVLGWGYYWEVERKKKVKADHQVEAWMVSCGWMSSLFQWQPVRDIPIDLPCTLADQKRNYKALNNSNQLINQSRLRECSVTVGLGSMINQSFITLQFNSFSIF